MNKEGHATNKASSETVSTKADYQLTFWQLVKKSRWQMMFFVIGVAMIYNPILVTLEMSELRSYVMGKFKEPLGGWNSYFDFYICALSVIILQPLRWLIFAVARPIMYEHVKDRDDEVVRELRTQKSLTSIYKATYFFFAVIWGYLVLRYEEFLPPELGGSGSIDVLHQNFPRDFYYPNGIRIYYLGTMGYHVSEMLHLIFGESRPDYVEMILHHCLTIFLYGASYIGFKNSEGALIMFLHDFADCCVQIMKIFIETYYDKLSFAASLLVLSVWGYTRLYMLPIILCAMLQQPDSFGPREFSLKTLLSYQMWVLVFMHYYWYYVLLKSMFKYLTKGKVEDGQYKIKKNKTA